MPRTIVDIVLWLFVIIQGVAFGAGLYELRIVIPMWFTRSEASGVRVDSGAMQRADVGRRFWGFVTTGPLTLLTLVSFALAWQGHGPRPSFWLLAAGLSLVERVGTLFYFIPTAIRLASTDSANESATASRWMALNHVRLGLSLIAWLAALEALSLTG